MDSELHYLQSFSQMKRMFIFFIISFEAIQQNNLKNQSLEFIPVNRTAPQKNNSNNNEYSDRCPFQSNDLIRKEKMLNLEQ